MSFLSSIYQYESVKSLKNAVRPIKHKLFGKNDIYLVMDMVAEAAGGAEHVMTIFDVGAASGEYTVHFLRKFPNATVYCFEPSTSQQEKLLARTKKFGDRVTLFPFGVWSEDGEKEFYVAEYADSSSLILQTGEKVTVPVRTIDSVLGDIKKIDFMKIDVEGAENEALLGAKKALAMTQAVFVEITPALRNFSGEYLDVFGTFEKAGLKFRGCYGDYYFSRK